MAWSLVGANVRSVIFFHYKGHQENLGKVALGVLCGV